MILALCVCVVLTCVLLVVLAVDLAGFVEQLFDDLGKHLEKFL
jgi:hypothetical protein